MANPPLLVLARAALTQDAGLLLPAALAAVEAGAGRLAGWLAGRAAALAPDRAWPYTVLAVVAEGEGGLRFESRAYRLDPGNEETLRRLAWRLRDHPASAGASVQRCRLAFDPAEAEALAGRARARLETDDPGGAVDLARAVRIRPALRESAYALGEKLVGNGRVAVAAAVFEALGAVVSPPADMTLAMTTPAELIAAVTAGASLSTVMTPDPFIPTNWPEYLEGYRFDHLVVGSGGFWALPPPIGIDPRTAAITAFAYFSDGRLFFRYIGVQNPRPETPAPETPAPETPAPETMAKLSHYPSNAYRQFGFVLNHDHTLVYDQAQPRKLARLEAAIRSGASLRLVLDSGDGVVQVLPVHLCFLYAESSPESGRIRVVTELRYVPELCLVPAERLWPYFARVINTLNGKTPVFVLDTGRDDAEGNPRYDLISLPEGVTPKDFPLGSIARRLETVEAVSRLRINRLVVHSAGYFDSFDSAGATIRRPFVTFRLFRAQAGGRGGCS